MTALLADGKRDRPRHMQLRDSGWPPWYSVGMRFTLLTHRKELGKRSATGPLVLEVLGERARQLVWQRTVPSPSLLAGIAAGRVALVWPGSGGHAVGELPHVDELVLPDGTWLTARKIHQKSPYLHHLPRVALLPQAASRYNLRPHQKEGGLCTAETVIALLRELGDHTAAAALEHRFVAFLKPAVQVSLPSPEGCASVDAA